MTRVTVRTARKPRRCTSCFNVIEPKARYLEHVASPHHDDLNNTSWWRSTECESCARRYGRAAHFDSKAPQ